MVEHYLDTVGVRGSKPLPRTIITRLEIGTSASGSDGSATDCSIFTVAFLDSMDWIALGPDVARDPSVIKIALPPTSHELCNLTYGIDCGVPREHNCSQRNRYEPPDAERAQ